MAPVQTIRSLLARAFALRRILHEIQWNPLYNSLVSGKTFAALGEMHKWLCTAVIVVLHDKSKRHGMWGVRCCARHEVTRTSTDIPIQASVIPTKLPATGIACRMSRATATGIRLKPPTPRFVGSKVIQPAPGT